MSATTHLSLGPAARAALHLGLGSKRQKVLGLIAVCADRGIGNPSVASLARASGLQRRVVIDVIESLERDGYVVVDRTGTGPPENQRAAFRLNLPNRTTTERNHPPMTTKSNTKTPHEATIGERIAAALAADRFGGSRPGERHWQRPTWLPELQLIDWPRLAETRAAHVAACERLAAARDEGDRTAISEAMVALCDVVIPAVPDLRANLSGVEAARKEVAETLRPPLGTETRLTAEEDDLERARIREARPAWEHDIGELRGFGQNKLADDTFPEDCYVARNSVVVEAEREREAAKAALA